MPQIARNWNPNAALDALKTTVGIILAWGIVLWQQLPDPFLAPVAVLFLQTPYLGASLRKGLMRVLGTLVGACLVLALLGLLIQDRWTLIGALSLVMALSVYMIRNSRYGYAWFMLALTVAIIAGDAVLDPTQAFEKAVSRTTEAVVGILVVLLINGLLWPRRGGVVYDSTYREALIDLADYMRRLGEAVAGQTDVLPQPPKRLRSAPVKLREILDAAALDSGGFGRLRRTYQAHIQALAAALGALMAAGETLSLAAEGERAFLSGSHRTLLGGALGDLADAMSAIERNPGQSGQMVVQAAVRAARQRLERLSAETSGQAREPAEIALLYAAGFALRGLILQTGHLADAASAVRAGRTLPDASLPSEMPVPPGERFRRALPGALIAAVGFWVMALLWIGLQWPPEGVIGLTMVVVVVGIETLANTPVHRRGQRITIGVVAGALLTAPLYFVVMPQLNGFVELALVLFPFYFAILYFFHALPPPRNVPFLGIGLMAILMIQLEPAQTYNAAGYVSEALSILTGLIVGIALIDIAAGKPPRERLRCTLRSLLATLDRALGELADRDRPDFMQTFAQYDQRLRGDLLILAEIVPFAYASHVPGNDQTRIDELLDAVETLCLRFGALQRARARWTDESVGNPGLSCPRTDFGRRWREAFRATLEGFVRRLDHPGTSASLDALDANRDWVLSEIARIDAQRQGSEQPAGAAYVLAIAGHYIGVARALRTLAEALDAIDWAAWRAARF